ncbi:MAG: hypothetical protein NTZ65_00040 [Candidatus Berkelbacteria bacterium]|nr:hypothetical protein [Candidatus Berkelbacteria bacterium]
MMTTAKIAKLIERLKSESNWRRYWPQTHGFAVSFAYGFLTELDGREVKVEIIQFDPMLDWRLFVDGNLELSESTKFPDGSRKLQALLDGLVRRADSFPWE